MAKTYEEMTNPELYQALCQARRDLDRTEDDTEIKRLQVEIKAIDRESYLRHPNRAAERAAEQKRAAMQKAAIECGEGGQGELG